MWTGKMCSCLKDLLKKEAYRRLNAMTPPFPLHIPNLFPEILPGSFHQGRRRPAQKTNGTGILFCRDYAEHFSLSSQNLIMQGGTGLGKTHLSLAIANEALEKGFGVIYGSAQNLATNLERERFSREPVESDTNQMLLSCDLLILDDLGTEFSTSFVDAAIYNVINTRLMTGNRRLSAQIFLCWNYRSVIRNALFPGNRQLYPPSFLRERRTAAKTPER